MNETKELIPEQKTRIDVLHEQVIDQMTAIGVDVVGNWHIEVHPFGRFSGGVWFLNLRQVQCWADKGFKDEDLPAITLANGTSHKQTLREAS